MNKLFFDIETYPIYNSYKEDKNLIDIWERFCDYKLDNKKEYNDELNRYDLLWDSSSSLYPSFSKILCISYILDSDGELEGGTLCGEDEKTILNDFNNLLLGDIDIIVGHNILQFDIPFIIRRMLVNGIKYKKMSSYLQVLGKKPWDLDFIYDLKQKLTFTSNFGSVITPSLEQACYEANIDTPKSNIINGNSLVPFIKGGGDITEIYEYCQRDVYATYELYNWLNGN